MKVLILTTRCGDGHNAMARAYCRECSARGHEAEIYDIFGQLPKENRLFNDSYLFAVKHFPKLYNVIWNSGRKKVKTKISKGARRLVRNAVAKLKEKIDAYVPDVIVSVHVNCGECVEILRQDGLLPERTKHIAVVFDYVICPDFEYNKGADFVITPSEICHDELVHKGFDKDKLFCAGFPVDKKFYARCDKKTVREKLGLNDVFTVLTMAGGAGLSSTTGIIKSIADSEKEVQIIAVCGRNEKEKKKIERLAERKGYKNVVAMGFTDKVAELMSAADVAFMRGGGNGISECFYSGLPVVFRNGLINNEKLNMEIFVERGICERIKNDRQAGKVVARLRNDGARIEEMKIKMAEFIKPDPTGTVIDFIEGLKQR